MYLKLLGIIISLLGAICILLANKFQNKFPIKRNKVNKRIYRLYYSIIGIIIIILGFLVLFGVLDNELLVLIVLIFWTLSYIINLMLFGF